MQSTMGDHPLTTRLMFDHGRAVFGESEVVTFEGEDCRRATFAEVAARVARLASGLQKLGIRPGDRVATLSWNTQEHLEAYLAVPSIGAVLHTLNLRLSPDQLVYVANHAADTLVIVDDTLVPLLAKIVAELKTVKRIVVVGDGDASALGDVLRYEELLATGDEEPAWPDLDERSAASLCYTTGTTGDPKGVAYSHRSLFLQALGLCTTGLVGLGERDRVLPVVPMFHVAGWGFPYAGWFAGADFVMPGRFLNSESLARLAATERPTLAGAVPTIWADLIRLGSEQPIDLSSLRLVLCGGSPVPASLMRAFDEKYGVRVVQGWGMTENPLGAIGHPPKQAGPADELEWRAKSGRVIGGVELRIVDEDGSVLPWDGAAVGEIEVRGPWVTASYFDDPAPDRFHDGWLRTGDVGTVDARGFVQITDRLKDVIKSGGEWISSVALENHLVSHPGVAEAAVIGVPDEKWQERPLALVVTSSESSVTPDDLRAHLADRVTSWWVPERWAFVEEIPRTSVGKPDKKVMRGRHADGAYAVLTSD